MSIAMLERREAVSADPDAREVRTGPCIALLGLFGGRNLGNEASFDRMVVLLGERLPDARLSAIASDPAAIAARHGIAGVDLAPAASNSISYRVLNRLLLRVPARVVHALAAWRTIGQIDAVVVPGTGALDDFGCRPFGYPADMLTWCWAARLRGRPLLFVSIGAGPAVDPISRAFFKWAAQSASFRSFRDRPSKAFVTGLGVDTSSDPIAPDLVFALEPPARTADRDSGRLRVGLGVMTYYGWAGDPGRGAQTRDTYLDKIALFAERLVEAGHEVRLIVGEHSDEAAVADCRARLRGRLSDELMARVTSGPIDTFAELIDAIRETDVVVATRFHNIVAALVCGRPAISLGYAEKNDVLMADVGLGDFCQSIEALDVERLHRQFERLVAEREHLAALVNTRVDQYRAALAQQAGEVAERLRSAARTHT
ncbi:MAG: polysaccharide pyruvyl transferase family protein [Hyphomicrobiaceae bacterium]|nr:polysaccharide pyruvyl transferase family protein [Hyphomicrobiaceae bacterium]